jgi:hypothetical protein
VTDTDGNEIGGATGKGAGYKYFGAAKLLPGVRELFEKETPRCKILLESRLLNPFNRYVSGCIQYMILIGLSATLSLCHIQHLDCSFPSNYIFIASHSAFTQTRQPVRMRKHC